jgi:protein TonB
VISGIDQVSDKQKVSKMHYQIHTLREQMFGLPDASGTYTMVDDQPSPEEGLQAFFTYIQKNLKYPEQARQMGIEGKVFVEFVVDDNGAITEVKALKGIGAGCDEEAVRVLQNAAAWNPGRLNGNPVKVRMILPITYKLNS